MDNEEVAGVLFALVLAILLAAGASVLTIGNTHINLERVNNMVSKCDNNGGLDYIEHDYDVKCKNGATFDYDRFNTTTEEGK